MATFKGEPLVGRTNYIKWENNAKLFLEVNGFMPFIDGSEPKPDKSLYYNENGTPRSPELAVKYFERSTDYERNQKKALGALKSIISIENRERFKDSQTAAELWHEIIKLFGQSTFELIGIYIDKLINISYSACKTMDEYTSQIQSSAAYLK
jgi:hypothetical protein